MKLRFMLAGLALSLGFSAAALPPVAGQFTCQETTSGVVSDIEIQVEGNEVLIKSSDWSDPFLQDPIVCENKTVSGEENGVQMKGYSTCSRSELRYGVTLRESETDFFFSAEIRLRSVSANQLIISIKTEEQFSVLTSSLKVDWHCQRRLEQKLN